MELHTPLNLVEINRELENKSPLQILTWVWETFGNRIALQSSMQKTASSLTHMVDSLGMKADVLFVDTGVHFPETLETRDELSVRYPDQNFITITPEQTFEEQREEYGGDLYTFDGGYQVCCRLRKEVPYLRYAHGRYDVIIGGLMRSEGGKRSKIPIVSFDERVKAYKIYPLANWDEERVDEYNELHQVPVNPLHAQGFPSIGCHTCTTPVYPGEETRAGRWRHIREAQDIPVLHLYCGINHNEG
jgi:phosphoadenosine phosphosulfate reductase